MLYECYITEINTGNPIQGAVLKLDSTTIGTTNSEGYVSYETDNTLTGTLIVTATNHKTLSLDHHEISETVEALEMEYTKTYTIEFYITDHTNGNPLSGAQINLGNLKLGNTNQEGYLAYAFTEFLKGELKIMATGYDNYVVKDYTLSETIESIELNFHKSMLYECYVLDKSSGNPIQDVSVKLGSKTLGSTNQDGYLPYEFSGSLKGTLTLSASHYETVNIYDHEISETVETFEMTYVKSYKIEFYVCDDKGTLSGALIKLGAIELGTTNTEGYLEYEYTKSLQGELLITAKGYDNYIVENYTLSETVETIELSKSKEVDGKLMVSCPLVVNIDVQGKLKSFDFGKFDRELKLETYLNGNKVGYNKDLNTILTVDGDKAELYGTMNEVKLLLDSVTKNSVTLKGVYHTANNGLMRISDGVVTSIPLPTLVDSVCSDKFGNIWAANSSAEGNVYKVYVSGGEIKVKSFKVGHTPFDICSDQNGGVWVATFYTPTTISKISNDVVTTIAAGKYPWGLCSDKNNNIYVTNQEANCIQKIVNGAIIKTIPVGVYPYRVYCDKDGAIWSTMNRGNQVYKIVNDSVVAIIPVDARPIDITGDSKGNIYVSHAGDAGVYVIKGNVVVNKIGCNCSNGLICDGEDNLWVGDMNAKQVYKIVSNKIVETYVGGNGMGICFVP